MSGHSLIGASSAYRWLSCPGSVRLYRQLTERRTSEYAMRGTAAHDLAEQCLRSGREPLDFLGETILVGETPFEVNDEMVAAVTVYTGHVRSEQARFGGNLLLEEKFSLEWLYPGMFGRNDAALAPVRLFDPLRIYDYKNGRKAVSAENNVQCMYYGLGGLGEHNPWCAEEVVCTIVQPNSWGKDAVETWAISTDELYAWGYDVLRPGAKRTEEPDAPCVPGDWCCFCEGAHLCPAKEQAALALLDEPTAGLVATLPMIDSLTPARIGLLSAFFTSDEFTSWVKTLAAEEQAMLARGVDVPGRKLIETVVKGNRRWASEDAVTRALSEFGEELLVSKLKSPAQVEKLMLAHGVKKGERDARLADLTVRDESTRLAVVSEGDPRAALVDSRNNALEML